MRTFHLSFLIALVTVPALITDASAHFRGHSHHHHLNRRGAIPTSEARLRQPIEFFQVFPDSSFTMGIGGAVLVDPGVHGLDQRLDQGLGVDLNVGVRLNHYVSLHLATYAPNFLIYEYMQSDWNKEQHNPLHWDLCQLPIKSFKDGYLEMEDKPGLGIELNEEVIEKYRLQ